MTPEGGLALGTAGARPCIIRPPGGGFQSGARISPTTLPPSPPSVFVDPR